MEKYYVTVDSEGTVRWHNDVACTILHRIGGPALVSTSGTEMWCVNNEYHRTDGPAFVWNDGTKMWFVNGLRHRTDGPAIECANGDKQWWVNGKKWSKKKFTAMAALCTNKAITIDGVQYKLVPV